MYTHKYNEREKVSKEISIAHHFNNERSWIGHRCRRVPVGCTNSGNTCWAN